MTAPSTDIVDAAVSHLIEVAFKGNRKDFFLWEETDLPPLNAAVIVDADRGEDLGHVHAVSELAEKRNAGTPHGYGAAGTSKKARRLATPAEIDRAKTLRDEDEDARRRAMERVKANDLVMKLTDAEWQWDRKKLTLYFTAERRVDFRTLVRELASMFRTRIELKQIGVRDEAKRLDGIGRCGRQYCSASWLPELRPVNLGVAKDQRLSLNPSQISGACGRLMCCLRYEHEFYVQSRKRFPKEGRLVRTKKGEEKIISNDIFRERVTLRGEDGEFRTILLTEFRDETGTGAGGVAIVEPIAPEDEPDRTLDGVDEVITEPDADVRRRPRRPRGPGRAPVADTAPAPTPTQIAPARSAPKPATTPPPTTEASSEAKPGDADNAADVSGNAANASDAENRRPHRRRGRRGGRRNRPARGADGDATNTDSTNAGPDEGDF
ncbi:MAG TPA: regulatory iron-sulfur-containing complex subunit RicT [Gemmatimonadaceae bacterium]|jgi:cell fate regulator YaaT (PSP1 superfamily)